MKTLKINLLNYVFSTLIIICKYENMVNLCNKNSIQYHIYICICLLVNSSSKIAQLEKNPCMKN